MPGMKRPPKRPTCGLIVARAATTRPVPIVTKIIGILCSTNGFGKPGMFSGRSFEIPFFGASGAFAPATVAVADAELAG